jgi:hypothetical protein
MTTVEGQHDVRAKGEAPEATLRAISEFYQRLFRDHREGLLTAQAAELGQ